MVSTTKTGLLKAITDPLVKPEILVVGPGLNKRIHMQDPGRHLKNPDRYNMNLLLETTAHHQIE